MNSQLPLVTVIIPSWNGRALLTACLDALQQQIFQEFEIIVVDNGSTDGTAHWFQMHYPQGRLISNPANRGFAAPINQGIRAAHSPYIVTLNNDTVADPNWLAALLAAIESAPHIGSCASKMLFAADPRRINAAGVCVDRAGMVWEHRRGEPDTPDETQPYEVFGPCAGAALYRRAMLDEIGLFDEDFFAYMEDVDLAWRARRAGWRCLYVPQARVLHHHSATAKEGSPFKSYHIGRNKLWLLIKNYPFRELWYDVPLVLFYEGISLIYALLLKRDIHTWRGRWAALCGARAMWRKRPRGVRADPPFLSPPAWPWQLARHYRHLAQNTVVTNA